jgi:hypothetical protein
MIRDFPLETETSLRNRKGLPQFAKPINWQAKCEGAKRRGNPEVFSAAFRALDCFGKPGETTSHLTKAAKLPSDWLSQ